MPSAEQGREGLDQKRQNWPWSSPGGLQNIADEVSARLSIVASMLQSKKSMSSIRVGVKGGKEIGIWWGIHILDKFSYFPNKNLEKFIML